MTATGLRAAPWGVLVVVAGNLLIDTVEVSSLFVLLPAIGADLGLGPGGGALVAAAFPLGFLAGIPAAAPAARRFGARTVLLLALLVFAAASVLSALAGGVAALVVARVAKGLSAGLTTPLGNAVLARAFADPTDRERASRLYALVGGGGFVAGLLVTAPLLGVSWQLAACWPAPVALGLAVAAARWMPAEDRSGAGRAPGTSVLVVVPVAVGVVVALAPVAAGTRVAVAVLAFGAVLPLVQAPLRSALPATALRAFATNAATAGLFNGSFLLFFATAQQRLYETGPVPVAALATAPVGLGMALAVPLTGTLVRNVPAALLVAASTACAGAAYLLGAAFAPWSVPAVAALSALVGIAFVLGFVPLNLRAVAAVPAHLRTGALGGYQVLVQSGAALAVPLGAALAALAESLPVALAVAGSALLVASALALTPAEGGVR